MNQEKTVLSISSYIALLNEQLKFYEASIIGEVTQVKIWSSGHVYFTLKDKEDGSVLDCVLWKHLYSLYGIKIEAGMELIASGQANIYAPSGRLSFIASSVELVGEGALKKAYDALKVRLSKEGLFALEKKRAIPLFPQKIGIITSKQGAVIHDFMNNLSRHGFQLTLLNTKVEGQDALPDLYRALRTMKKRDVEVIVLMRGGGSLQSLAAFDAEQLVREVATCPMPIIAAIGHHQDVPLCALAADMMVSTPTAAANVLNSSWEKGSQNVLIDYQKIVTSYKQALSDVGLTIQLKQVGMLDKFNRILHVFSYTTSHMPEYVSQIARELVLLSENLARHEQHIFSHMGDAVVSQNVELETINKDKIKRLFSFAVGNIKEQLEAKQRLINVYDPMRQLALGYSLVRGQEGRLVKSAKDVTIGETLIITTGDGSISSLVK